MIYNGLYVKNNLFIKGWIDKINKEILKLQHRKYGIDAYGKEGISMSKKTLLFKIGSLFLICSLALAVGCTKKQAVNGEDLSKVPEEPYEIKWYTRAPAQRDVSAVEQAANEYLKDKLNVTLKLNILDAAQYTKKMTTMIAAGEEFDLAYCAGGLFDYADYVRKGAFFDMAAYVDEYMPNIREKMDPDFFATAYVDGKIGAVPTLKEISAQWGLIYRKDIAEKYGINMNEIKSLEELEPHLKKIKQNEPDMEYPMEWDTTMSPLSLLPYVEVAPACVVFLDNGVPRDKVELLPETEEFKKLSETTRRFYNDGLVKPDALTAADAAERFKSGKAFAAIYSLKPDAYKEKFPNIEYPIDQVGFTPNTMGKATSAMIAISGTSKNPYRVMRFLNLLYEDEYLSNLMVYGVEGVHYNLNSDGRVEQIENSGYDLYSYQYTLGNIFLNYLRKDEQADKHDKLKQFSNEALPNIVNGFFPNNESYELEAVSTLGVKDEYKQQSIYGTLDPKEVVPRYLSKLKEAGIEKQMQEVSKQYSEYLKTLNK